MTPFKRRAHPERRSAGPSGASQHAEIDATTSMERDGRGLC